MVALGCSDPQRSGASIESNYAQPAVSCPGMLKDD
jgi:hypothetical protein